MQECCPPLLQNAWQQIIMQLFMIMVTPKHINDHLRCRRDNGATCLNCKVDFSLEMLTTALLLSSPLLPPRHSAPFTFEMQAVQVSHSARPPHPSFTLPVLTRTLSPSLPTFSLALSMLVFSPCPGMIKDSFVTLCEASRKQETSNH